MPKHERLDRILGQGEGSRDAVHIAITPVVAAVDLNPGEHIGLTANGKANNTGVRRIGVVSPFLRKKVNAGETFYILLYPGSITSLRHEWTHPDFENVEVLDVSKKWLLDFARKANMSYDYLMKIGKQMTEGRANVGDDDIKALFDDNKDELIEHMSKVLNCTISEDIYFSCAC